MAQAESADGEDRHQGKKICTGDRQCGPTRPWCPPMQNSLRFELKTIAERLERDGGSSAERNFAVLEAVLYKEAAHDPRLQTFCYQCMDQFKALRANLALFGQGLDYTRAAILALVHRNLAFPLLFSYVKPAGWAGRWKCALHTPINEKRLHIAGALTIRKIREKWPLGHSFQWFVENGVIPVIRWWWYRWRREQRKAALRSLRVFFGGGSNEYGVGDIVAEFAGAIKLDKPIFIENEETPPHLGAGLIQS